MPVLPAVACILLCAVCASAQDPERNFAGTWKLNVSESEIRSSPAPLPDPLRIEHSGNVITIPQGTFETDGSETRFTMGQGLSSSSRTKWEGRALLISSVVSGTRSFSVNDRWTLSKDRNTLRIRRQIVTLHGESESTFVYEREGHRVASASETTTLPQSSKREETSPHASEQLTYTVATGTKIPLKLIKSVSTKTAAEGDRVYLETAFPVVAEGRVVIPPGSAVAGTVTRAVRPGRVKGRGELFLRFDSVTLPNGITREFRARPDGVDSDTGTVLDREEGRIQSAGTKAKDARTAGKTAAAGAAVGSIAGRGAMGVGVGAASGAAAGLAGVLLSRGADTELPRGSIVEMELDRPLVFSESEIGRWR